MGALFYVAIDDTDNLESRGTGHQARALAARLAEASLGTTHGVTRHQLLLDRRIPFTSHNSSACLLVEARPGSQDALAEASAAFLVAVAAPGSDAGLCVAPQERVTPEVVAWGRRAKEEVLTKEEAHALAARCGIHLSGHTGQRIGVIGSLAAVGLRHAGGDGRFLELTSLRSLKGIMPASDLLAAGIGRFCCENSPNLPGPEDLIDVGEWCRPILREGLPTLLIEEVFDHGDSVRWHIVARERIKQF